MTAARKLEVVTMPKFPIPELALEQHIAALGKTGSGKTSTSKLIIEHVVEEDYRVCVLDPIKSDWWGITSSADGKRPGLPFTILGGPHGHVPLHAASGKVIGELVATGKLPLSILDMKRFRPGEHQKFFIDFAETLMQRIRGVVYLVIEEAHFFAPKERSGIAGENMAIYWAKMLATGGRSLGVRLIVATQRTQALHNALLGSCDTMIVHRFTAPADQEPVQKWLKGNIRDKAIVARIENEMSSLPTGTAWLCSGEAKVFELVKFPRIKTFDNTATPEKGGSVREVKTATVDRDKLAALIGEAVDEAKSNDPAMLKAELARVQRELAAAKKHPAAAPAKPADEATRLKERDAAYQLGLREGAASRDPEIVEAQERGRAEALEALQGAIAGVQSRLPKLAAPKRKALAPPPAHKTPQVDDKNRPPAHRTAPPAHNPGAAAISSGGRELLKALAWWAAAGHDAPLRAQVAAVAGLVPSGSTLRARLSELQRDGFVEYPEAGRVSMTEAGAAISPPPDTGGSLIDFVRQLLSTPQAQLFDALHDAGDDNQMTRDALAIACGLEPSGSTLRARLSELHRLEIIRYPSKGVVKLQDWVTE